MQIEVNDLYSRLWIETQTGPRHFNLMTDCRNAKALKAFAFNGFSLIDLLQQSLLRL